jgi:hypothetical protein
MALIDKASLLMVPSTYEAGKLYNVLPSGNRAPDSTGENSGYDQTRADFDFDRGSNTAATRVNADGLIEKYRENFLTESNNFSDSDWLKELGASVTSGQSGYDGNSNAWELTTDGTQYSRLRQTFSSISGVKTYSLYAKAGSLNWLALYPGGGTGYAFFDLENGTTGNIGSGTISANIEPVGTGGWYRCEYASNESITDVRIYFTESNGVFTTTAGSIYIQNAQLESGMVATDYLESTSVTGKAGVLIDLPRIDYSSGAGALLLEPSRQQLVPFSEYISGWTASGLTISENQTTSPEGVQNAAKLTLPSGSAIKRIALGSMPVTAVARSFSFFVKSDDIAAIQLLHSGDLQGYARFDISSGVVGSKGSKTTSDIEDYGNGWYRCTANFDATNSFGSTIYLYINDSGTGGYGGSTSEQGDLFVWGGQYEAGSYSTSYIPNHSGTGGVTRAADSCSVTGASDVIDSTQGTIYFEGNSLNTNVTNYSYFITLSDGTQNNRLELRQNGDEIQFLWRVGGTYQNNIQTTDAPITEKCKVALKYSSAEISFYLNGSEVGSIASPTLYSANTLNRLGFDDGTGSNPKQGKNSKLIYFNEALSDSELETLTTL